MAVASKAVNSFVMAILGGSSAKRRRAAQTVRGFENIYELVAGKPHFLRIQPGFGHLLCHLGPFSVDLEIFRMSANPMDVMAPLSFRGSTSQPKSTNSRNRYEDTFQDGIPGGPDRRNPRIARRRPRHEGRRQVRAQSRNVQMLREVLGQMLRQGHEEVEVRSQEVCGQMLPEVHGQVRPEMRSKVHAEVRSEELMARTGRRSLPSKDGAMRAAGLRLLETYAELARQGSHLFGDLLEGQMPRQWSHYPEDDAIDHDSGFHWFYHSHSPEDRPGASEHGHIHLFARRKLWSRRQRSTREMGFAKLKAEPAATENTRHLLTIGFDAKGIPTTIFTVNSWVTGDRMLSSGLTLELLSDIKLDTGNRAVDTVIESLVRLYQDEIGDLLARRDEILFGWSGVNVLSDEKLELLSEVDINVDAKLARAGA